MSSPQKFYFIIQSDNYDKVHSALVIASAALAIGRSVTLFFTMSGTRILTPGWVNKGQEEIFKKKGLATFETLLDACNKMDASIMVCQMGLLSVDLTHQDLRKDIKIIEGSAVTFLSDLEINGALLCI
ncbi:MAG: DsrE/DsrF/DrsH-like family protein [Pseudomonadota bacterium]|nr:DsrE/DsrF/DrsH-like family protein [Pseudomonadota bacterium]